jgi:hypothetical protein
MLKVNHSVNQHSRCHLWWNLKRLDHPRANADGDACQLPMLYTSCSDAVYLVAHSVLASAWFGDWECFLVFLRSEQTVMRGERLKGDKESIFICTSAVS